jgi:hypothetical protein
VAVDPATLRAAYLDQLRAHLARLRQGTGQMSVDYVPLSTAQGFDYALARYVGHRMKRKK